MTILKPVDKLKILKIHINYLDSIRTRVKLDFQNPLFEHNGLFAIVGDTGSGKTTIVDAMTLVLYGKVFRNKDVKEVMSYGIALAVAETELP